MKRHSAEIVREYGPFAGVEQVEASPFDGRHVWFASGDRLNAVDPASGEIVRSIDVAAHAGTAFDGKHLFQIAEDRIQKIDPASGTRARHDSGSGQWRRFGTRLGRGLAVGRAVPGPQDPSGRSRDGRGPAHDRIQARRHRRQLGRRRALARTWEGEESELRRIDPQTGKVLERIVMPPGTGVSGLESDGGDRFFCGGGKSGKVRAVRRPRKGPRRRPASSP